MSLSFLSAFESSVAGNVPSGPLSYETSPIYTLPPRKVPVAIITALATEEVLQVFCFNLPLSVFQAVKVNYFALPDIEIFLKFKRMLHSLRIFSPVNLRSE